MNISIIHSLIMAILTVSVGSHGILASAMPNETITKPHYVQQWLEISDIENRQSYDVDRGELSAHLVSTYTQITGKAPKEASALKNPFLDVSTEQLPYVVQAASLGITDVKNGEFKPNAPVTRAELSGMLYNMVQKAFPSVLKGDLNKIDFFEEVPPEYEKALSFAFTRGIIVKQGNGKIGANTAVTLGEMATVLNRFVAAAPDFKVVNDNLAQKRAYLTFDDATSKNTTVILDTLKKYNVKATFFVTGRSDANTLKRIKSEGHTIGNHTMSHNYKDIYATPENFWEDFDAERDYLLDTLGDTTMFMRFPGGSNNAVGVRNKTITDIQAQAKQKGYIYVDWNVDSGDARAVTMPKETIIKNVLEGSKNKMDAIILMHQTKPKTTTAEALPEIIEGLRGMGFELCALDKAAYYPRFMK